MVQAQAKTPLQNVEVIRESVPAGSTVAASVTDGPVTTAIKAKQAQTKSEPQARPLSSADRQKEARIAAARERRKRQGQ